jgi:hypothetical protein
MSSSQQALDTERVFRKANQDIADVAHDLGVNGQVPFLCECDDPRCHQVLRTTWTEFASLHAHDLFVVIPGHEHLEVEELVVETRAYSVVRKLPVAA